MIVYYSKEFTGGHPESRRFLENAFARHTGDSALAGDLIKRIKNGDRGKPYIDGFSSFSVSHTGSIWAALLAEVQCGLDIQMDRSCDMTAVAKRVFSSEDVKALHNCSEEESKDLFFRIWTRREALAKALGGSAFESGLPPVLNGCVTVEEKLFTIADIPAEAFICPDGETRLYASVCIEGDEVPSGLSFVQI